MRHPIYMLLLLYLAIPRLSAASSLRERLASGECGALDEIVFATRTVSEDPHWYANLSYFGRSAEAPAYSRCGRLIAYNFKNGSYRVILSDPAGSVRDPCVHYDGRTILFSYRPAGEEHFHLYTVNADGSELKQLTTGGYDDIEPAWLPDGDIVFVSTRCRRWVNCWVTQVATIYRMKADGSGMRMISANPEHDNTPWVLPDGRILYMRWEYVDRRQVTFHHLWTMNPDGTQHQIYQGNTYPGSVYIDAKPIPGTEDVVLIDSPGHGRRDHGGIVSVLSTKGGPDNRANVKPVAKGNFFDPWAFGPDLFMFTDGKNVFLCNRAGKRELLCRLPAEYGGAGLGVMLYEPRPLMPHPRERILADRTDLSSKTGEFYLENVLESRSMKGVKPGTVKRLMVFEVLPKPINFSGGMEPLTFGGSFSLPRLLGWVPVEPDGSAYFKAPALKALFFVAVDADGRAVKRMQSFTQVMPGERQGCVGCHERKTANTVRRVKPVSKALARGPSEIDPTGRLFDVADFPRDMQPVLDRACVKCHNPDVRKAGLDLCGDRGPMYSMGYLGLILWGQVLDGRNLAESDWPPYARGSGGSPLMKKIDGSHHGVKVSERDRRMVMQWLDASAPYAGTYAALGSGFVGHHKSHRPYNSTWGRAPNVPAHQTVKSRCAACHTTPHTVSDGTPIRFHRKDDPRNGRAGRYSRHLIFNLTRPEKSMYLMAPLAKEAGGLGLCTNAQGKAVFATKEDPGYAKLLAVVEDAKKMLDADPRFDMPNFCPNQEYIREMKRYGILPQDADPARCRIDPYDVDRRYWSLDWTDLK
ncbi:MAG: PD40 domain-containing protein [Kiritimatiellae bacterium]|nr:PD40 domain-containing protein [Kiritimatiellia bacterium]